jgi:hypothetical protein
VNKILIEPKNASDITLEEAEELAGEIRISNPKYEVRVQSSEYIGKGVTLFEVLNIWILSAVSKQMIEQITKSAIDWARKRFNGKDTRRSTSITIYGPNGKAIKSVVIKNASGELEDRTATDKNFRLKLPFNPYKKETAFKKFWRRIFKLRRS